jgi:hypothetical protein
LRAAALVDTAQMAAAAQPEVLEPEPSLRYQMEYLILLLLALAGSALQVAGLTPGMAVTLYFLQLHLQVVAAAVVRSTFGAQMAVPGVERKIVQPSLVMAIPQRRLRLRVITAAKEAHLLQHTAAAAAVEHQSLAQMAVVLRVEMEETELRPPSPAHP